MHSFLHSPVIAALIEAIGLVLAAIIPAVAGAPSPAPAAVPAPPPVVVNCLPVPQQGKQAGT